MSNPPIISIQAARSDRGGWQVVLIVSGLTSEQQAVAAMNHLAKTLCGQEIKCSPSDGAPT